MLHFEKNSRIFVSNGTEFFLSFVPPHKPNNVKSLWETGGFLLSGLHRIDSKKFTSVASERKIKHLITLICHK